MPFPSRSNALASIQHMPNEILCDIFLVLASPPNSDGADADSKNARDRYRWTVIMHVCRQWRNVARNYAMLLRQVNSACPEWAVFCMENSGTASIEATIASKDWHVRRKQSEQFCRRIIHHLPRVKHLTCHFEDEGPFTLFLSLKRPAPRLTTLCMSSTARFYISLPSTLFQSLTPALRSLTLESVYTAWDSPLLQGLSYLTIKNIPAHRRPTTTQLLAILSRCPQLESLHLDGAGPVDSHPQPDDIIVTLPHLRQFLLVITSEPLLALVNAIRIDAVKHLNIKFANVYCEATHTLVTQLFQKLPALSALTVEETLDTEDVVSSPVPSLLPSIWHALVPPRSNSKQDSLPCPRLSTLELINPMVPKTRRDVLESLQDILWRRAEGGARMQTLVIRDHTSLAATERAVLESVVDIVTWVQSSDVLAMKKETPVSSLHGVDMDQQ